MSETHEDVSRVLGSESSGWPVVALDQTYLLTPVTYKHKDQFEKWMKVGAKNLIMGDRAILPRDEFVAQLAHVNTQIAIGVYRWGGPVYLDALNKGNGFQELARILLQKHQPDISADEVRAAIDDNPEDWSFTLNLLLDASPNSQPPPSVVVRTETAGARVAAAKKTAKDARDLLENLPAPDVLA